MTQVQNLSAARLYEDQREELQLEVLTESLASKREITLSDINRPGMALMGFVENFLPERIQIIAQTEVTYLHTLSPGEQEAAIQRLFQFELPLIVICKGLEVPKSLIDMANRAQVPVLRTPKSTTPFIHALTSYLDHMFAPTTTAHGSLVDVYGVGLMFIDVQAIFGIRSIRLQKRIEVEVRLSDWSNEEDYERVGLDERKTQYLDVEIPLVLVPITPGKNITVIAEVIALNYLVKVTGGFSPAERLNQHLIELMKRKSAAKAWVREDTE
jgi:HPr kinase/phosphorylase